MKRAKVGLDCRLCGRAHGGIGRYELEVLSRILQTDQYRFFVYVYDEKQRQELASRLPFPEHITWKITPIHHYSLAEQTQLAYIFYRDSLDLLHVPHFNKPILYLRPTIITIHDLLWHQHRGPTVTTLPTWQYWLKYCMYRIVSSSAVRQARIILVPSKTIREAIRSLTAHDKKNILVTYEGVDDRFQPSLMKSRKANELLYVGSLYPHKNVSLLLEALLSRPTLKLIIVTSRDVFTQQFWSQVTQKHLTNRVELKQSITDAELIELYQTTSALVQPSFSEGFGLTGVEAMACQTQLLASDIPIFREIYGEQAFYFDPNKVASFLKAFDRSQRSPKYDQKQLVSRYNWDNTAAKTLQAYAKALSG